MSDDHPTAIEYSPSSINRIDITYDLSETTWDMRFSDDPVIADPARHTFAEAGRLATSPHWQDRVRAAVVAHLALRKLSLPQDFWCIYEPAAPASDTNRGRPRPFVWVASPDEAMLRELLPLYRELWEAYESQWPARQHRIFELGQPGGIAPWDVYRPGTTAQQVIARTMRTHEGMHRRAPAHLRRMLDPGTWPEGRFDQHPDEPYATCSTCHQELSTEAAAEQHARETLARAEAPGRAEGHRVFVLNPTRQGSIAGVVSEIIQDSVLEVVEQLARLTHTTTDVEPDATTDEITAALTPYAQFAQGWRAYLAADHLRTRG